MDRSIKFNNRYEELIFVNCRHIYSSYVQVDDLTKDRRLLSGNALRYSYRTTATASISTKKSGFANFDT